MTQQEPLAMPLEEAMRTQRSIRRIKSDPVDDSLVLHLLELAMKAPTGSNAQNWEFIVGKDREVVAKLGHLNRRAIKLVSPIYTRSFERRGDQKMLRLQKAVRWQADHFDEIPSWLWRVSRVSSHPGPRWRRAVPTVPFIRPFRTSCCPHVPPAWARL
ncbi:MAG: hypothetical protein QOF66_2889 [Mycobacterium sp.]|jgi:nitroreductase|nr:hypothetical protein [Mycobacterium sp.]